MNTPRSGQVSRISARSSIPDMPGMLMSESTSNTPGGVCPFSTFSAASPEIAKSKA